VIDASAAAEVLFRTPVGDKALAIIGSDSLVAPELIDAEVLAFIRRKTLQGIVSSKRAKEAVRLLTAWPILRLPHRPLLVAAFAMRENVSAYDALYVAAASAIGAAIVTADGPLARAPLKIKIHNIRN
jgi:predicted nucleic acid-binding protein